MTDLTRISVTSTAETALKKLSKANIPVYDCKKRGAEFIFCIKDKDIQKVFAIFKKPCYNIRTERKSAAKRLGSKILLRAGLVAGAVLFAVAAYISNLYVFKVEVSGSGSYLKSEVVRIISEEGAGVFKPYSALDVPKVSGRILSLPGVGFCNISKRGSVLLVDVEVNRSHSGHAVYSDLTADRAGVVENIVAICGTPCVSVGDSVGRGDVLISAYTVAGDKNLPCAVAGYAELRCFGEYRYLAPDDSAESLKKARASLRLESDNIISFSHTVKNSEGGFLFVMEIVYLHKISMNLT